MTTNVSVFDKLGQEIKKDLMIEEVSIFPLTYTGLTA